MVKIRSLSWKFGAALILVAVVSLGLMAFLIHWNITRQFENYIKQADTRYTQILANTLGQFYGQEQSWAEIQLVLDTVPKFRNIRLIIVNSSGLIVGDTENEWTGKDINETNLDNDTPIVVSGQEVGKLYYIPSEPMLGRGPPVEGPGRPPHPAMQIADQNFLRAVISSLWIVGIIAIVIALLLGLLLTRQITRPVQALKEGTRRIAEGDLSYRVTIKSKDEIGDVAQSFNKMASSLDRAEQSRRHLNADIAHELRTPLTVIKGTIDGIIDGVLEADHEHLDLIKEQTSMLTRLTQDIRDLSLAESGQLKLEPAPTDIVDLVQRKVAQARAKAREKTIKLDLKASREVPAINIDPIRIEQVIANLLANALHHTPTGGSITISIEKVPGDGNQYVERPSLIISFSDTGRGIEPDLPHIFDRFYRIDDSRTRSEGGTGLGLAIVKQMVEAHGGQVWVESEPGKGSSFYIALPLQDS